MPYPIEDIDGLVAETQDAFVRNLRRNLTAAPFFPEVTVQDLGIKEYRWREISDLDGVRATMEIPDLSATDAGTVIEKSEEIPVFTRDVRYDGRQWMAYQRSGLQTEDVEQAGRLMGEFMNDYLWLGASGFDEDIPGPAEGPLNHTNRLTLDNTGTSNWETPEDMANDLSEAAKELLLHRQGAPFTLLMHPGDSDLLNRVRAETDSKAADILPDIVSPPVFDEVATSVSEGGGTGKAYLFKPDETNFKAVTPFGLGAVERVEKVEEPLMAGGIWIRFLQSAIPVVQRPDSCIEISYDRS